MRAAGPRCAAAALAAAVASLSLLPAAEGASLRLSDGRVLEGRDVRREGEVYVLELEGDTAITVPVALVAEVGLGAGEADEVGEEEPAPVPGLTYAEPRVLSGAPVVPPRSSEQLAVLGPPSQFPTEVFDSGLEPSYWYPDPDQHNFNPSTWIESPVDPDWEPTPAFDPKEDTLAQSRSTWTESAFDPSWAPVDAFAAGRD